MVKYKLVLFINCLLCSIHVALQIYKRRLRALKDVQVCTQIKVMFHVLTAVLLVCEMFL